MHGILIAPSAFREAGNALGYALGYGPDTYSVPLYQAAVETFEPTHYGACSPVTADFVALVHSAESGVIPTELEAAGYTGSQVQSLISQLILDFTSVSEVPSNHFDRVIGLAGLSRYPYDPNMPTG